LNSTKKNLKNFDSKKKFGKLSRQNNDSCFIIKDNKESTKPLKYYTRDFFDKEMIQEKGINFHSSFGTPPCSIDDNTSIRIGDLTNYNLPRNIHNLPLPTTAGLSKGQGHVETEQRIRPRIQRTIKPCQPREDRFHDRHFYIFDSLPVVPNKCVKNVVQKNNSYRQGEDSRYTSNKNKCNFN